MGEHAVKAAIAGQEALRPSDPRARQFGRLDAVAHADARVDALDRPAGRCVLGRAAGVAERDGQGVEGLLLVQPVEFRGNGGGPEAAENRMRLPAHVQDGRRAQAADPHIGFIARHQRDDGIFKGRAQLFGNGKGSRNHGAARVRVVEEVVVLEAVPVGGVQIGGIHGRGCAASPTIVALPGRGLRKARVFFDHGSCEAPI